jgi:PAS domain S-box-containing protein
LHPRLTRLVRSAPVAASLLVGACGLLVLIGWMRGSDVLKAVVPGAVPMNPTTALCFILLAAALWMLRREGSGTASWAAATCATVVAAVGMLRLVGYLFGGDARVDEILFRSRLAGNVMAPNTAAAFVLTGLALIALDTRTRLRQLRVSQFFLFAVGCISALALLGYLYRIGALYSVKGYIPMALNTAFCFALMVVGTLCARPGRQPVATLLDDTVGGAVARRLLPAAFILPVVLGYVRLLGERHDVFSAEFGLTLFVLALIVLFNGMVWWNAQIQRRIDQRRKLVEDALRISEERHRTIMEQAGDGITLVDAESLRILEVNHAFARLLGYPREELTGRPVSDFIVDTPDGVAARAQQTLGGTGPTVTRRQYRRKDGSIVHVEKSASTIMIGGRRVLCTVIHDVTERKRAEEKLAEERNLLRTLIDNLPDRINVKDPQGRYVLNNIAHLHQMGLTSPDEVAGKTVRDFYPPDVAERLEREDSAVMNERRGMIDHEEAIIDHDGQPRWVLTTRVPILDNKNQVQGMVGMTRDITERKRAEQALQEQHRLLQEAMHAEHAALEKLKEAQGALVQSEKLAGLGQMVAGVAHEINNPLAFVSNNVAVLQRDLKAIAGMLKMYDQLEAATPEQSAALKQEIRNLAERIDLAYTLTNLDEMLVRSRDGLKRIQQIVKDLRDFARLDAGDLHETDLNSGIESTVNIVRGLAKKKQITLDLELGKIPQVACYPAKINQVVMNLVTNAIDATDNGGRVTVRSAPGDNGNIKIEVADTGKGIPPEIRQRIFDPFFTTKPIGQGTGLGLSISYGIVKDHGGKIEVDSEVGKGTKFVVTLPVKFAPAKKEMEPQMNADERR